MSASAPPVEGADALGRLAAELRTTEVIAPHVLDSDELPALGMLAASGPRAATDPADYVLLFEAIREGYLLHYGRPRLLDRSDPDLLLLAGDYLYALGLRRLAGRGDMEAVRELGDLISLSAQLHARGGDEAAIAVPALWLAAAVAVAKGTSDAHEAAKAAVREGRPEPQRPLLDGAVEDADEGIRAALARAADSIGFASEHLPDRG
jgi:hypothetical protein